MSKRLSTEEHLDIIESIAYIRGVFPSDEIFKKLVDGDAVELYTYHHDRVVPCNSHHISGDDLEGACYHLNVLMKMFNVE